MNFFRKKRKNLKKNVPSTGNLFTRAGQLTSINDADDQPKAEMKEAKMETLTTRELAKTLGVVPDTIRRGLCIQGNYLGLRPVKLPNGRLLWNREEAINLVGGK